MSDKWAYARDALKGVPTGKPNEVLLWDLCQAMTHDRIRAALLSQEAIAAADQAFARKRGLAGSGEAALRAALEAVGIEHTVPE